jgi:hypothetical protein
MELPVFAQLLRYFSFDQVFLQLKPQSGGL